MKKRTLAVLLGFALMFVVLAACDNNADTTPTPDPGTPQQTQAPADETLYHDFPFMTVDNSTKDDAYYEALYNASVYNNKLIKLYPTIFENEGWHAYRLALGKISKIELVDEKPVIDDNAKELLENVLAAQAELKQLVPYEGYALYMWGDDIATAQSADQIVFTADSTDNSDFVPFIVPYILEDQTDVKGNILIVSGGGYTHRSNDTEGYVLAEHFNELGYNTFVIQRRVEPYAPEDAWLDLQRSVRYIRHNIDELGLGSDFMIANGFSGGGRTVMGTIENLYGDVPPTIYDADYVPDEVDAENSDFDVIFTIYGPLVYPDETEYTGLNTDNPNLPAMFIAHGMSDSGSDPLNSVELAREASERTMVELHVFGNVGHGFGDGLPNSNTSYWPEMADNFVAIVKNDGTSLKAFDREKAELRITGSAPFTNDLLQLVDDSTKDDAYYQAFVEASLYNNRVIRNYPTMFEDESWHAYRRALNKVIKITEIDDDAKKTIDEAAEALAAMAQIKTVEDNQIFIWGDQMASIETDPSTLVYDEESWDNPDFRPFLVPYILEDQTDVLGNIIIVSGGGYTHRANDTEGYVLAEDFNSMGYNVFVLQRRVAPYAKEDCWLDLQRSIRYVRHNLETLGLGSDKIIINGYSGGGMTCMGTLYNLYGDIQPTVYDPDYVPDEIDAESADVDVAVLIYGALLAEDTDPADFTITNPNFPDIFIAAGENDESFMQGGMDLTTYLKNNCPDVLAELHIFGNTGHGFTDGLANSNSVFWPDMANDFIQISLAKK